MILERLAFQEKAFVLQVLGEFARWLILHHKARLYKEGFEQQLTRCQTDVKVIVLGCEVLSVFARGPIRRVPLVQWMPRSSSHSFTNYQPVVFPSERALDYLSGFFSSFLKQRAL